MHLGFTRLYGRAPKGERVYDSESLGDSGQNISLIGGMSLDGLIATMSIVGSVNTDVVRRKCSCSTNSASRSSKLRSP